MEQANLLKELIHQIKDNKLLSDRGNTARTSGINHAWYLISSSSKFLMVLQAQFCQILTHGDITPKGFFHVSSSFP
jgi:hypothetical protein